MSFNFRAISLGVGAYVFSPDGKALMIVHVNAEDPNAKALDETDEIRQHHSLVLIEQKYLKNPGSMPAGSLLVWPISGRRLSFRTSASSNEFKVAGRSTSDPPPRSADPAIALTSFDYVPQMNKILPANETFAQIDDAAILPIPQSPHVASQVVVTRGIVGALPPRNLTWKFEPPWFGGVEGNFAHAAAVDLFELDDLALVAEMFGNSADSQKVGLQKAGTEDLVQIHVVNICASNPLGWPGEQLDDIYDHDFKWCYYLCADRVRLVQQLNGPLPMPVATQPFGTDPAICFKGEFPAKAFTLLPGEE